MAPPLMRARQFLGLGVIFLTSAVSLTAAAQSTPRAPGSAAARGGVKLNTAGTHVEQSPEEDKPKEPETRGPVRLPWRGTGMSWDNSATTSALGLGGDYQSGAFQQYTQTFSLGLNYFVVEQDKWSLAVSASPSFSVELTNSGETTTRREPWFNDLPLSTIYRRRLYANEEKELFTGMVLNGTVILPTSPGSYNAGTYFTASPRFVVFQTFPLLGHSAKHFQSFSVGASVRWDHRFGAADTAVNPDLNQPRMDSRGSTFLSDDLTFNRLAQNSLRQGAFIFFSEDIVGTTLQFFASFGLNQNFLPALADSTCDVTIQTGCVDVKSQGAFTQFGYSFAAGFTWFPMSEFGVYLNYANGGGQLGPDGQRRSVFYNPNAQVSAGIALGLDAIYETLTGWRRKDPFFLVAKREEEDKKRVDKKLPARF